MHAVAESPSVNDELPLSIEEAEIAQDLENIGKQPDVFAKLDSLQNGFCGREVLLKSLCQNVIDLDTVSLFFVYSMLCFRGSNEFSEASFG